MKRALLQDRKTTLTNLAKEIKTNDGKTISKNDYKKNKKNVIMSKIYAKKPLSLSKNMG